MSELGETPKIRLGGKLGENGAPAKKADDNLLKQNSGTEKVAEGTVLAKGLAGSLKKLGESAVDHNFKAKQQTAEKPQEQATGRLVEEEEKKKPKLSLRKSNVEEKVFVDTSESQDDNEKDLHAPLPHFLSDDEVAAQHGDLPSQKKGKKKKQTSLRSNLDNLCKVGENETYPKAFRLVLGSLAIIAFAVGVLFAPVMAPVTLAVALLISCAVIRMTRTVGTLANYGALWSRMFYYVLAGAFAFLMISIVSFWQGGVEDFLKEVQSSSVLSETTGKVTEAFSKTAGAESSADEVVATKKTEWVGKVKSALDWPVATTVIAVFQLLAFLAGILFLPFIKEFGWSAYEPLYGEGGSFKTRMGDYLLTRFFKALTAVVIFSIVLVFANVPFKGMILGTGLLYGLLLPGTSFALIVLTAFMAMFTSLTQESWIFLGVGFAITYFFEFKNHLIFAAFPDKKQLYIPHYILGLVSTEEEGASFVRSNARLMTAVLGLSFVVIVGYLGFSLYGLKAEMDTYLAEQKEVASLVQSSEEMSPELMGRLDKLMLETPQDKELDYLKTLALVKSHDYQAALQASERYAKKNGQEADFGTTIPGRIKTYVFPILNPPKNRADNASYKVILDKATYQGAKSFLSASIAVYQKTSLKEQAANAIIRHYLSQGQLASAEIWLNELMKEDRGLAIVACKVHYLYAKSNKKKAKKLLTKALREEPDNEELLQLKKKRRLAFPLGEALEGEESLQVEDPLLAASSEEEKVS